MDEKDMEQILDSMYSFILKKLKKDPFLKNILKRRNATVTSVNADIVNVCFPYEKTSFPALNKTGETLAVGDLVCVDYWVDLKNAVAVYKVNN